MVDDDEVMRELLPVLLGLGGEEEIAVVGSGDEALAWLKSASPELIMTDLQMPGIEGEKLVAALRQAAPDALLLGMSGSVPPEPVLQLLDTFVSKPFGAGQLEAAIEDALATRQAQSNASRSPEPLTQAAPGEFEKVTVLDEAIFSALASRFDSGVLVEFYTLTLDDVTQRYRRIEQYAAAGDLDAARREAHSIKGACGMVGARELQHLAAVAERGTMLNTSAIADFPAACARLQRMLDAKFHVANKNT